MNFDFTGKKVLITGAGRGIGRELALKLHECGAEIFALGKTPGHLDELGRRLGGVRFHALPFDLLGKEPEDFRRLLEPHGPYFDFLVNNAGLAILEPFLDMTPGSFDQVFGVNFKAAMYLTQYVASGMVANGVQGSIVNISSQASVRPLAGHAAYGLSKSALDALTRLAAWELGPAGVRVNGVAPTVVLTDLGRRVWVEEADEAKEAGGRGRGAALLAKLPLRRFAEAREVVDACLFLLSDASRSTTGATLPVDAGASVSF